MSGTPEEAVVVIFRSRLDESKRSEYEPMAARMAEMAGHQPGFHGIKTFVAEDGERVSIVEFDSMENAMAWRAVPEHREAQTLARSTYYEEFELTTCQPLRRIRFQREEER